MKRCKWCIHARFTCIAYNDVLVHGPECSLNVMGVKYDSFNETDPPSYFCGYYEMHPDANQEIITTTRRYKRGD